MRNLKEKYGEWALITGASSGIGEEFAKRFASAGLNLVLIARRGEKLERLKIILVEKYNIKIIVIVLDLTQIDFIDTVLENIRDIEIGILVNNAGIGSSGEFKNADSRYEESLIKLNCIAPVMLTHHLIKPMVKRKKGAVVFLGSIVSFQPTPYSATYSASKVFNSFLGDSLWYEMKKHNVDVLSLNPGGTKTEFIRLSSGFNNSPLVRTAEQVVDTALKALGKKPSVVDGIINKTAVFLGSLLPRRIIIVISGMISENLRKKRGRDENKD